MQNIPWDPENDPDAKKALSQVNWDDLRNLDFLQTQDIILRSKNYGQVEVPEYLKAPGIHIPRQNPYNTSNGLIMEGLFLFSAGFSQIPYFDFETSDFFQPSKMEEMVSEQFDYKILIGCEPKEISHQRRITRDLKKHKRSPEETKKHLIGADNAFDNWVYPLIQKNFFDMVIDGSNTLVCSEGIADLLFRISQEKNLTPKSRLELGSLASDTYSQVLKTYQ